MAAPTVEFGSDHTGTITTTGEANGLLKSIPPNVVSPRLKVGFSGTFTSVVVAVRGRLRELTDSTVFYPVVGRNLTTGLRVSDSSSIALTNSTNAAFEFDVDGYDQAEVYVVSGTPTSFTVEEHVSPAKAGDAPMVVNAYTTASTFAGSITLADNALLQLGTDADLTAGWDGTDIDVLAAADNTMVTVGASGNSFDFKVFGSGASTYATWDASLDSLKFEDNVFVGFGSNTAGVGTKGDINITFDGTDLLVAQTTADTIVKWGVSGAGINHLWYGGTATYNLMWDQSNDQLLFSDNAKLAIGSGAGAAGDITFSWNATKLLVAQLTANSAIDWGVDGAGIDQVWYGDTASTSMTWDQSADSLILTGAAPLVFTGTTGQPFIGLTDNLADALSCGISGSTDLFVLTTTDNAESFSPIGLRCRQSTAVAITGATTLKLSDSGGIWTVSQGAAYDIDLPSPTSGPGCTYFFSLTAAAANNVTITVAGSAATFVGSITIDGATVVATGSTLTFASGASSLGDSIEVRSIATNLYHVRAFASAAGGVAIS